jgi:hypothetical protein
LFSSADRFHSFLEQPAPKFLQKIPAQAIYLKTSAAGVYLLAH